ncbi:YbgA family protein [Desulforhopalus sp. 52FAK]
MEPVENNKIIIGVSSCLLGNKVRFDGGHKHDRYITGTLGTFFDFVPVCPEVECGLPIPREAMRLVGDPEDPLLLTSRTGVDHTKRMKDWTLSRVEQLADNDLCGFIFKSKSPSSGMERVKVYGKNNMPRPVGVGLFARAFMERFPLIPVEEEGRLHDMVLRENFIESVFVYRRWRALAEDFSLDKLVHFHTEHKMLLRSHSEKHYRELGRVVAKAGSLDLNELLTVYQETLMAAMRLKPTVKKHVNVLQHMMGYFKKQISSDEKQELLEVIESYRQHHVPLIVPITMMNHYVRKYNDVYLEKQYYLKPHPTELKLRNHA